MKKIASFFGWIILGACICFLPYVGVKITYVCLPAGVIGTAIWWILSPDEKQENENNE